MFLWWTGKELSQRFYCFCGEASDMCRAMNAVIIYRRWQAERTFCLVTVNLSFQTRCVAHHDRRVIHSCSPWAGLPPVLLQHGPPFLAIEKWILRQNSLRRQMKTPACAAFGDTGKNDGTGEGVILESQEGWIVYMCLSTESQGREISWSCILFHSQF